MFFDDGRQPNRSRGTRAEESPLKLLQRIRAAKRRREPLVRRWRRNLALLNGDNPDIPGLVDRIDVNMVRATADVLVPAIYFQNPDIIAEAKQPNGKSIVPIIEAAVAHWIDQLNLKRIIQRLIVDALMFPWGVIKLGYETTDTHITVEMDPESNQISRVIDESEAVQLTTFPRQRHRVIIGQRPVAARISPLMFYLDPRSTEIDDADWVAEHFIRHIDEMRNDPSLENTRKLRPNMGLGPQSMDFIGNSLPFNTTEFFNHDFFNDWGLSMAHGPFANFQNGEDPDFEGLVSGYEFHHTASGRIYVVADGHDEIYFRNDPQPYDTKLAYHQLQLAVAAPDNPYPQPPCSVWEAQQEELNELRTCQLDHVKRATPFYMMDVSRVDPKVQGAIRDGRPMRIVPVRGSVEGILKEVPGARLNPELHQAMQDVKDDIRVLSGIAEFQRGTVATGNPTATEQKLVATSVGVKTAWMRDQVSDLFRWAANTLKDLLQQFADKPTMIRLTGRSDFEWGSEYVEFTKKDIQGDFVINIIAGSQGNYDPATERKEALDEFQLFFPIALQTGIMDPEQVIRRYIDRSKTKDADRLLKSPDLNKPPSDPQSEDILFASGGTPTVSWNDDHAAHIQFHDAHMAAAKTPEDLWRRITHRAEHVRMAALKGPAALGASPTPAGAPSAGAPPPPGPGGPGPMPGGPMPPQGAPPLAMGMGRNPTQPGQPMNPRLFHQKPPDMTQQMRVNSRGGR